MLIWPFPSGCFCWCVLWHLLLGFLPAVGPHTYLSYISGEVTAMHLLPTVWFLITCDPGGCPWGLFIFCREGGFWWYILESF